MLQIIEKKSIIRLQKLKTLALVIKYDGRVNISR